MNDSTADSGRADPLELTRHVLDVAERSQRLAADFCARHHLEGAADVDPLNVRQPFSELWVKMVTRPEHLFEHQLAFWQDYMRLWQQTTQRLMGVEPENPVIEPEKGDRRFRNEAWDTFLFDFVKQSYLLASRYVQSSVESVEGLDEHTKKKVEFYTRQFTDALSPTNFVATNPEVVEATVESGGENLVKGLQNMLEDLERGDGRLSIKMTDTDAFRLGENIATTPGKVVYQNELMQLLQYEPTTETVHQRPVLVIPPWINKYYILDLREKNSFIKWLVEQGHTVFVISWVNPDESLAEKTFEDYLLEGLLAAIDAIELATGEREINAIGYCLGGTLLTTTLAYLAARDDKRIRSATFFASLIDFEEPGELEVFIDEEQLGNLERQMNEKGYLDGAAMATTFNMLRANDLIWSFVINNYLLGKEPFAFDLLYWNSDSTRMPAAMHSFYLRNMYQKNLLREPGGVTLAGVPIDLSKVKTPAYFLSTREDHIAPWKATYAGARLLSGPVRFVLGESGHIAGVVNPPAANKYGYFTNTKSKPKDPQRWLDGAARHEGSWWPDWDKWVSRHAGPQVPARKPGEGGLEVIEDAPGSYVRVKSRPEQAAPDCS